MVETVSNMIVRTVRVNRARTPQEALNATGYRQYTDQTVVDAMPRGESEETEVVFFKPRPEAYDKNGLMSDESLEKEFEFVGLKPADPYSLAAVNEDDPSFADEHPNGSYWKDADSKLCYVTFYHWGSSGPEVYIVRSDDDWGDRWWFAGLRK